MIPVFNLCSFWSLFPRDIKCFRIRGGVAQEGITEAILHLISIYAFLLVSRLISKKIIEIHYELPEISRILEYGRGVAAKGGNIFLHLFQLILIPLVSRQSAENVVEIVHNSPKLECGFQKG